MAEPNSNPPHPKHGPHLLPIFERFPQLAARVPWITIGHWPTPVQEAKQFGAAHGLRKFFIKREDLSHPHGAGNKVRGLEFLLAQAEAHGVRKILTASSAGSHHICKTAWHARQLGIDTIAVVVPQPAAEYAARNLLLGASVGTRFVPANLLTAVPRCLFEFLRPANLAHGRRPWWIAPGGTTPRSCLGHVNAAFELKRQIDAGLLPEPDYLFVAMGSIGTAAGLALGCELAGLSTQIVGVVVSYRLYATRGRWAAMARRTLTQMRQMDPSIPNVGLDRSRLHVVGTALGGGYAQVTPEAAKLSSEMHELEGLELDGTYTSKTLHGAMQFIQQHGLEAGTHLLWHTYHAIPRRDDLMHLVATLPRPLRRYFEKSQ